MQLLPFRAMAATSGPTLTVAAGGDLLGPYHGLAANGSVPVSGAVATLFRGADIGFANEEGSIFDLSAFGGYPAAENGGGYPLQPAATARFFRDLGIDLVAKANNHATDWGDEGLVATLHALAAANIAEAGAGTDLSQARAATTIVTAAGPVALVAASSTFPPLSVAGAPVERQGRASNPRPGISVLHVRRVHIIGTEALASLSRATGLPVSSGEVRVGDEIYRSGGGPGETWEMDQDDEAAILGAIRGAKAKHAFVLFSLHAHETSGDEDPMTPGPFEPMVLHRANEAPSPDDPVPAAFVVSIAHAAIEAGADMVLRTGPHVLSGIEIYHDKPIFYGLGSLFFDFNTMRIYRGVGNSVFHVPDSWFETMIPVCTFTGGQLTAIRLHPMTTMQDTGRASGGTPQPATGAIATGILSRLAAISRPYGTAITIDGNTGMVIVR